MNDSRTLEYWKNGQWGRALARTAMYASGLVLALFLSTLLAAVVVFLVVLPATAFLMDQMCHAIWDN